MLRANLWLQMEQVGDFISALNKADNAKIMQFKAQVERLAHQLGVATAKNRVQTETKQESKDRPQRPPSTITVGTLLNESERRRNAAAQQNDSDTTGERHVDAVDMMIPLAISTRRRFRRDRLPAGPQDEGNRQRRDGSVRTGRNPAITSTVRQYE